MQVPDSPAAVKLREGSEHLSHWSQDREGLGTGVSQKTCQIDSTSEGPEGWAFDIGKYCLCFYRDCPRAVLWQCGRCIVRLVIVLNGNAGVAAWSIVIIVYRMNIVLFGVSVGIAEEVAKRYNLKIINSPDKFDASGTLFLLQSIPSPRYLLAVYNAMLRHEDDVDAVILCSVESCEAASTVRYCTPQGKFYTLSGDLDREE